LARPSRRRWDASAHPLALWPSAPTFEHLTAVWESGMAQSVLNSVWVALGATLLALALAFPAAYALARLAFPARLDLLFLMLVLALKLMPPITVAVPLFSLAKWLHLLDSLIGLILAYQLYALPMAIWMLLPFVRDVPIEFEEAAALDGANLAQRIVFIVMPLCAPGLVATAIFVFIIAWNEFLLALLFVSSPGHFTLALAMEWPARDSVRTFAATFEWYVAQLPEVRWHLAPELPLLQRVRGGIVLLRRFASEKPLGIDLTAWPDNATFDIGDVPAPFTIQDEFRVPVPGSIAYKWRAIDSLLDLAPDRLQPEPIRLRCGIGLTRERQCGSLRAVGCRGGCLGSCPRCAGSRVQASGGVT
jgi:ABC-type glycerol-3-phosphate transport system permease component